MRNLDNVLIGGCVKSQETIELLQQLIFVIVNRTDSKMNERGEGGGGSASASGAGGANEGWMCNYPEYPPPLPPSDGSPPPALVDAVHHHHHHHLSLHHNFYSAHKSVLNASNNAKGNVIISPSLFI